MTGKELREKRKALNLTCQQLGDSIGYTRAAISDIELKSDQEIPKVVELALKPILGE